MRLDKLKARSAAHSQFTDTNKCVPRKTTRAKTRGPGSMKIASAMVGCLFVASVLATAQTIDRDARFSEVVVKTVSGNAFRGQWLSLSLEDGLLLNTTAGEKVHLSTDDLVRIETNATQSSIENDGFRVETIQRNTFVGHLAWSENSKMLRVVTPNLGVVDVAVDDLRSIQKRSRETSGQLRISKWLRGLDDSDNDRILTSNGDTVSGFIVGVAPTGIIVDTGSAEAAIAFTHLAAISMANVQMGATSSRRFIVTLNSGSQVTTRHLSLKHNSLSIAMPNDKQIDIDPLQMRAIEVIGARWVWLSSLEPISDHHTPMLSQSWPMKRESNVLGNPMKVAGETFEHGLGVHSRSSVSYDLRGQYAEFVTFFGLDDSAGGLADVDVHILVDGRRQYEKSGVTIGTLHGPIRIDVHRAHHLELIVDFGQRGDVQDRFNWIEPALVR